MPTRDAQPPSNGGPPLDEPAPRIRVIRIHLNDWVASTRGLTLAEEGFFWRFTCLLYDRMGVLVDDDKHNARAMNLDVRAFRHMKNRLIELGKVTLETGRLSHPRVLREVEGYVAEYKRRSEAAREREANRRAERRVAGEIDERSTRHRADIVPISPRSRGEVEAMSTGLRGELTEDFPGKDNEINGSAATSVGTVVPQPSCARAFPKPKPKPEEERNPLPPQGDGADAPTLPDLVAGADLVEVAFEDFWRAFPLGRKRDKGKALGVFRAIVTGRHRQKHLRAKAADLIEAARRYAASKPDPEYTPMPTTWLNGGRWLDDVTKDQPDQERQRAANVEAWDDDLEATRKLDGMLAP